MQKFSPRSAPKRGAGFIPPGCGHGRYAPANSKCPFAEHLLRPEVRVPLAFWGCETRDERNHVLSLTTIVGKSGRGLPQSKTLRDVRGRWKVRQVLDCASPLALWRRAREGTAGETWHQSSLTYIWTAPVLWRFGNERRKCEW